MHCIFLETDRLISSVIFTQSPFPNFPNLPQNGLRFHILALLEEKNGKAVEPIQGIFVLFPILLSEL
jgi:hypothetical protein